MNHEDIKRNIVHSSPEALGVLVALSDALQPVLDVLNARPEHRESALAFLLGVAIENLRGMGAEEDEILNLVELCFDSLRNTTAEQRATIEPMVRALARPPGAPHFRGES